jgi:hypothetical protein
MSSSSIRAEIARGLEIIEAMELGSSPSKKPSSIPNNPGSVNIFYNASPGNKVFLGTVSDRSKLAQFSLIARDQLVKEDARASKSSKSSIQHTVVLGRIDHEAGLLVLEYINNGDIAKPKPVTYDLLPANSTLALRCKVHQACNAFRIPHRLCGDEFRDRLCFEIRHLPVVTFADFQLVCDTVPFDAGLMNVMQNKVAYHTLRGWITEHELACIWEYVSKSDAVKGSNYVERINANFAKLEAEAAANGRVFKSGWCDEGVAPPAPQGVVGQAVALPTRPKDMIFGAVEKPGQQIAADPPAVAIPTRPKNMTANAAEKAPFTSTEASSHVQGAHIHPAQSTQSENSETTFVRPSTAGPPQDVSSPLKRTPTKFSGKGRTASTSSTKAVLKPGNRVPSTSSDNIDWSATETTTPPTKKAFSNVGGVIGAIEPAPGLSKDKGKGKVPVPEEKKEQDEDKDDKEVKKDDSDDKGKGKEDITPTQTPSTGSSSAPGKMSYAQMLGSRSKVYRGGGMRLSGLAVDNASKKSRSVENAKLSVLYTPRTGGSPCTITHGLLSLSGTCHAVRQRSG